MKDMLKDKLHFEYEKFYLSMVGTSKANLFANSAEIELKKKIAAYLLDTSDRWPEAVRKRMQVCDNVLEEAYRYVVDHPEEEWTKGVNSFLHRTQWLNCAGSEIMENSF